MTLSNLIYMAEDDVEDFSFFEDALKEVAPHTQLKWMKNGEELIRHLDQTPTPQLPSLIVLDYNMPRLNGLQVLIRLNDNERYRNIPKVFYTSGIYVGYLSQALEAGASAYFEKAATINKMKEDVRKIVEYAG